jgi:hypothetical protein
MLYRTFPLSNTDNIEFPGPHYVLFGMKAIVLSQQQRSRESNPEFSSYGRVFVEIYLWSVVFFMTLIPKGHRRRKNKLVDHCTRVFAYMTYRYFPQDPAMQFYLGMWQKAVREMFEKMEISLDVRSSRRQPWRASRLTSSSALNMETMYSSETSDSLQTTQRYNAEDCTIRKFCSLGTIWMAPYLGGYNIHIHGVQAYVNTNTNRIRPTVQALARGTYIHNQYLRIQRGREPVNPSESQYRFF